MGLREQVKQLLKIQQQFKRKFLAQKAHSKYKLGVQHKKK
jgi:hypothetical protein